MRQTREDRKANMIVLDELSEAIIDTAIERGFAPQSKRSHLLSEVESSGRGIDEILMRHEYVEEADLIAILGIHLGYDVITKYQPELVDKTLFDVLPKEFWEDRAALPTRTKSGDAAITIGLPFNQSAVDEINFHLGQETAIFLSTSLQLRQIAKGLGQDDETIPNSAPADPEHNQLSDDGGAAAGAVGILVEDAVSMGASDIHLVTRSKRLSCRVRVNGLLQGYQCREGIDGRAMFARLKLMAGLNVTEMRLPQDGSCQVRIAGRSVELRLSTLPTQDGESMVCRILDPKTLRKNWAELGFPEHILKDFLPLVERPSGLFVISGPTGSGKSTTLYAALRHLNDGTRKIMTVEDPIEQRIEGLVQVQVNAQIGLGFGTVLRTCLRHDPDVLMIGEIRDEETAEIACRAALVGRLVLATVHASNPKVARERFINLGIPAYLIDEVLLGVMSQALNPTSCAVCAGSGCDECANTGRSGRKPGLELWVP